MKKRNVLFVGLLAIFFSVSFLFRFYGLWGNDPFWSDEFYTASQARTIMSRGLSLFTDPKSFLEYHNITTHFLVALFFKIFGQAEWTARLPLVIIGSLVPVMVFIFSRRFFNFTTAITATLLTTFSYLEITWSRQARGYPIQQFLVLLIFYLYLNLIKEKKKSLNFSLLIAAFFFGILTHVFFYLVAAALIGHYLLLQRGDFISIFKKPVIYLVVIVGYLIVYLTGFIRTISYFISTSSFGTNNIWYYHSFLWREYGLVTFLAIIGFILAFNKKNRSAKPILIYITFHLFCLFFIIKPYVSRYLMILFPFFFIFMAYALVNIGETINIFSARRKFLIPIILTFFIIANGHKFVNRPKQFYSVNHDFREIALVDYHDLYNLIREKIQSEPEVNFAIIETNTERANWYLGQDYKPIYLLRWTDEPGFVNGLARKTLYTFNSEGERVVAHSKLRLVATASDLKKVLKKYSKGFIYIDDASMPKDIISYARANFKKELYLDHYPHDDNPYSIWPATLYSWGID